MLFLKTPSAAKVNDFQRPLLLKIGFLRQKGKKKKKTHLNAISKELRTFFIKDKINIVPHLVKDRCTGIIFIVSLKTGWKKIQVTCA